MMIIQKRKKKEIFNDVVDEVIRRTYQTIAEPTVVSSLTMREGIDVISLARLINKVSSTVKDTYLTDMESLSICMVSDITILLVEFPNKFDFRTVFKHIEFNLKRNPNFKLILVGGGNLVDTRILPVLRRYVELSSTNDKTVREE